VLRLVYRFMGERLPESLPGKEKPQSE